MDYSLEVKNLNKQLNNFSLNNLSFNIPSGSIVGLVGENGAGKTTTLKTILNITQKDSGEIIYFGKDLESDEINIRNNLGVVLDDKFFHDNLSPKNINNINKYIFKNWDSDVFFNYLEKFNLPKDKIIKEFSKGMKVKLSLSIAFSHNPKLLILDEPTSGLDPIVRNELLDILLEFIQDENHSILFSTHITSDLDKIADYIIFINQGKIVFEKDREELLTDYGIVKTTEDKLSSIPEELIIRVMRNKFNLEVLINNKFEINNSFTVDNTTIEDIMLFYIKGEVL